MAVDLTDEEKTKFSEHLKELGYDDHAKKVIERVNNEAKSHREAKEKLESELKTYRDEAEKRKSEDEKRKNETDAEKKKAEDEKKTAEERALDERLAKLDAKLEARLKEEQSKSAKQIEELTQELSARDQRLLEQAIRVAAEKRGIIDGDLVRMIDASKVPVEKGVPLSDAIDELIEEHAKSKPHLYKSANERKRSDDGGVVRPEASRSAKNDVDWANLSDEEFEKRERQLRATRA